jgi:hypothetical protein
LVIVSFISFGNRVNKFEIGRIVVDGKAHTETQCACAMELQSKRASRKKANACKRRRGERRADATRRNQQRSKKRAAEETEDDKHTDNATMHRCRKRRKE